MPKFYCFERTTWGAKGIGYTYGDSPQDAMNHVLGSHPKENGVTYAFVYLPDEQDDPNSDFSLEWGSNA